MLSDRQFTFDRVIRLLIAAGVVWGVLQLLDYLSDVLIPFAIALLLAYLINPLVDGIQRGFRLKSRPLAVAVGLLLFTLVVAGAAAAILPLVLDELARMRKLLAAVIEDAAMRDTAVRRLPEIVWRYVSEALSDEKVRELITFSNIREVLQRVLPGVWGVFSGAMSLLFGLLGFVVVGIYLVFILMDYRAVTEGWKELIPPPYRARVIDVVGDFSDAMRTYFRAQAFIALIVGGLHALGFWLIGLPLGIVLGFLIGLLNMVPFLQIAGVIPAVVFALLSCLETGTGVWTMLFRIAVVFGVAQLIQDMVLTPRIMGKVTGFNPVVILLSVSIWGKLLGLLGLIIALPMTFLLYSYYRRYLIAPKNGA